MKQWPFTVVEGRNGRPMVEVETGGEIRNLYPEQIQAIILQKIRQCAEIKVNKDVVNCVVTVPAYFNLSQKEATK